MVLTVHFTEIQKFIYNFPLTDKKQFVDKYWWLFPAQIKNVRFFPKFRNFHIIEVFYIFVIFSLDVARFVLPSRLECSINIPPPFGLRRTSWALPSLPAQILCKGHRFTHRLDRRAWPTTDLLATRNFRFQRRWEGRRGDPFMVPKGLNWTSKRNL